MNASGSHLVNHAVIFPAKSRWNSSYDFDHDPGMKPGFVARTWWDGNRGIDRPARLRCDIPGCAPVLPPATECQMFCVLDWLVFDPPGTAL